MKACTLISLSALVIPAESLYSQQAVFPLHVGDRWEYSTVLSGTLRRVRISRDTLMPNAQRYAVFESAPPDSIWPYDFRYLRQAGNEVYHYNPASQSEEILYRFDASPGDTLLKVPTTSDTIAMIFHGRWTGALFGVQRRHWDFGIYPMHMVDAGETRRITDSLGLTDITVANGGSILRGALINGVQYGDISSDSASVNAYYPLATGNEWFYRAVGLPTSDSTISRTVRVVGDTLFPDALRYSILDQEDVMGGRYVRTDSSSVFYRYSGSDQRVFRLNAQIGDTMRINWGPYGTAKLTSIDTAIVLGVQVRALTFELEGTLFAIVRLCEKFGPMTEWRYSDPPPPWPEWGRELVGCIIDGVRYGRTLDVHEPLSVARAITLHQNYPNPFNPTTVISYQLPVASDVKLVVYDLLGREVRVLVNERKNAGSYEVKFDASGPSSGVYFYRLQARHTDDGRAHQIDGGQARPLGDGQAGEFTQTRKMLLVR
jgi:hypothetical protein